MKGFYLIGAIMCREERHRKHGDELGQDLFTDPIFRCLPLVAVAVVQLQALPTQQDHGLATNKALCFIVREKVGNGEALRKACSGRKAISRR